MPVETVNTVQVQDREYGADGKPLVNQEVTARLAPSAIYLIAAGAAGNTDQVALQPVELRTKTDATGFWSLSLVSNNVITPSNTYYSVKVGLLKTYDIAVPAGAGPFVAQNILTGALPLFPGGSSVAGPITITGNLSVTGTGTYTGALSANGGLAVLGGGNINGGLTLAGLLTMTDAASRLVPGATSFSVRDTGNANDNLLVSNAGNVTVRGTLTAGGLLTVSTGGAAITGAVSITGDETLNGRLVMSPSVAKIVGGATSLSHRNNADSADNVLIADAGTVTLRNALQVPTAASGSLPPTSYGTVPLKYDEQTPTGASVTIPASGSIPGTFRVLRIVWQAMDNSANTANILGMRFNGDTGANYDYDTHFVSGGTLQNGGAIAATSARIGATAGTGFPANSVNGGWVEIPLYAVTGSRRSYTYQCWRNDSVVSVEWGAGAWRNTANAITSVTILPAAGSFLSISFFITELRP